MRTRTKTVVGGLAVVGGAVVFRPGTRANRGLHRLGGQLQGVGYRLSGRRPDPNVSDDILADRVRSTIGPLEKRLDIPHVHVMVEDHVALLHGEVGYTVEAKEIEHAVAAVSGINGVESYLHVGLVGGDTRPSIGKSVQQPSEARQRLLRAATDAGALPMVAPAVVRAVLATFADRIPEDERDHVAAHLPADVRDLFTPPRRLDALAQPRTVAELVARISSTAEVLGSGTAEQVTAAVIRELRALVPDEAADVAAVLPTELRALWQDAVPA